MFAKGFDKALKDYCKPDWLCIPSRFRLDAEKWECGKSGPIDYLYLTYPYEKDDLYGTGLHGKKWIGKDLGKKEFYRKEVENKDKLIDDIMTIQGSCWFMPRQLFFDIGKMDTKNYYMLGQEAQELGFKVWLSGGRVVRNKRTWYAHMHKSKKTGGRGFSLSKRKKMKAQDFSTDFWMNNKWDKRTRDIEWLINKFWPIPGWPEDWNERKQAHKEKV